MRLEFIGAAHEVTGSCHYLNACGKNILIDCGLEQGPDLYENQELPVAAGEIDYVLLTHAHIDHSGKIPLLCRQGFAGEIVTTFATSDLCNIMLRDSAHIQEFEAEWRNRKGRRSGEELFEPLYTMEDADAAIKLLAPCDYEQRITLCEGIDVQFHDMGHLLGSASIEVWVTEDGVTKKIVFSGDVGNANQPIIKEPQKVKEADYIVIESTYGDRTHGDVIPDYIGEFTRILRETFAKGGEYMNISKVWAVYFSPTGGTEKAVRTVAEETAAGLGVPLEAYDFTLPQNREDELAFAEGDFVVFGTPVIAGRVPNVLLPYLKEKVKGGGALAAPVVSFGNRNFDDALIELRNILEDDGFRTAAGGAFISEHSFSRTLGAGRPDAADLEKMRAFGRGIAEKLQSGWTYTEPVTVRGETPIRPYFTPRDRHNAAIDIRKVKPKTSDACCGCGLCAEVCPMGSISRENPAEFTGICIKCCACVKKCPTGAKFYDDPGYVYHKEELEELYERRAEPETFL